MFLAKVETRREEVLLSIFSNQLSIQPIFTATPYKKRTKLLNHGGQIYHNFNKI